LVAIKERRTTPNGTKSKGSKPSGKKNAAPSKVQTPMKTKAM